MQKLLIFVLAGAFIGAIAVGWACNQLGIPLDAMLPTVLGGGIIGAGAVLFLIIAFF